VFSLAEESAKNGHGISAGEEYLRAAQYYLAAEVYLHTNPDDPRILEAYKKGGGCFIKGLTLLGEHVELVAIPYETTTLRGYFFRAAGVRGRAPTIIVHQGYDAPVESTKYVADAAVRRGYNCLMFEGPGQGLSIREKKLTFRPDWEKVVSPVIDYAVSRSDVDPGNLILMGISFGGGLAARAAAYEHRIKILVLNPGYVNLAQVYESVLPEKFVNLYKEDPEGFNDMALDELAAYDVGARWGLHHGMWVFGAETPADLFTRMKEYDYAGDVGKIRVKTVVMDGTAEQYGVGQSRTLYDLLTCSKYFMQFTGDEHAGDHCQIGAPGLSMERLFNWLDENR
jgi:pimeloyl-ACP methyl ester carboxylesterase